MRATLCLFGALAATLLASGPLLAQQVGAGGGLAPAAPPQPGVPGGIPFQPGDQEAMREQMQERMAKMMGLTLPAPTLKWGGMTLEPAAEALLDQLDLPVGKGMVVASVESDSAAAKAGLKKNDLLVKVNADAVPGDARSLLKALTGTDAAVDIVVLRKGKEQTLKAVKLAAPEMVRRAGPGLAVPPGGIQPPNFIPQPLPGGFQPFNPGVGAPDFPGFGPGGPVRLGQPQFNLNGAKLSLKRDGDKISAEYEKGKIQISIHGKMDGNKTKLDEITVKDGDESKQYTKVEDVPQTHRDTINHMVRILSGGAGAVGPMPGLPGGSRLPPAPGAIGVPPPTVPEKH